MNKITTPVYIKTDDDMVWPEDKFFYLVAREGVFRCRNHEFFQSCVIMKDGPKELASQHKFLRPNYPKIPQALLERAVGFFHRVWKKQNSEAVVVLGYNRSTRQIELIVPDQIGINGSPSKYDPHGYPMDVKYEIPKLPPTLVMIGDIHCHVDGSAYASGTDTFDEKHRAGIHIVVGHIDKEPPTFHTEIVQDGERFTISDIGRVAEGYTQRRTKEVPEEWMGKVKLEAKKYSGYSYQGTGESYYGTGYSSYGGGSVEPSPRDLEIINGIISRFKKKGLCPTPCELRQCLFTATSHASYRWCEQKSEEVVNEWIEEKTKHEPLAKK